MPRAIPAAITSVKPFSTPIFLGLFNVLYDRQHILRRFTLGNADAIGRPATVTRMSSCQCGCPGR